MPDSRSKIDCVWCGASLADGERLAGRTRCRGCGVSTTDPWPSSTELDRAYGPYRPTSGRFAGFGDALFRGTRSSLAGRIDRIAPSGPILDVGAGDGALLGALHRRGREAVGLERTPAMLGMDDRELSEVTGSWAAIVFWHSLEHLPEPGAALEHAAGLLAADGVIVVAAPNSDSLQARAFGDRWLALDLPRHLVHLTSCALRQRLESLGLRIERVSYIRGGQVVFGWLDGFVGALPGHTSLYDAIRRPEARFSPLSGWRRVAALLLGVLLLPLALVATAAEVVARRGGTVYIEARALDGH
jgi:SAM-dependent methyltransferase